MRTSGHPSTVDIVVDSEYERVAFERAVALHDVPEPIDDLPSL
jgi:hypothetical protein